MNKRIVMSPWGLRRQYCHCDTSTKKSGPGSGWNTAEKMRSSNSHCDFTAGSADDICNVCNMYPWTFKRLRDEKEWKKLIGYIPIKERGEEV